MAYEQKGMHAEAIEEIKRNIALGTHTPDDITDLGCAYALAGMIGDARRTIDELVLRTEREYIPPASIARLYACLGDKERAFQWLDKAYQVRDPFLVEIGVDPGFGSLRADPRYEDLLDRMGLK
jgi:hypothetical protein